VKKCRLLGLLVAAALFVVPAAAEAATLTNAGRTLTYTAAPGSSNQIGLDQQGASDTVDVYRFTFAGPDGDNDPIVPAGTCTEEETHPMDFWTRYECPDVDRVDVDAADQDDTVDAGGVAADMGAPVPPTVLTSIPIEIDLGEGSDLAAGGRDDDIVNAGSGNDLVALDGIGGGPGGNDQATGGDGVDDVLGGRGNDTIDLGASNDSAGGGPGTDALTGGDGDDSLASGPGDDTLRGGAGNDTLRGECDEQPCAPGEVPGADDVDGGDGFDLFVYETFADTEDVTITLEDNAANDGQAGESDNVRSNVEDVRVSGPGAAVLTGSSAVNTLSTGDGDDTINSRDGNLDRVACGAGTDTATADTLDIVDATCETVNRADAGNPFEDKPPTVAWTAPASGASLSTTSANTLSASASDDKGIARVQFLDDERTVCSDATAPYSCDYRPQGDDVGRNTLVAIAVDTSGQTASAVRAVVVPRFVPTLSARTTPRRDTSAPYRFATSGRLTLPAGVTPAQGCEGTVTVQIKAGSKTVSTRRAQLRSNCTYRSQVTFRLPSRLRPRTLRVVTRFGGNEVLSPDSAPRQTVRVRR